MTKKEAFKFAEWLGWNYIRLNECWVFKYSPQTKKEYWKSTEELYKSWKENDYKPNEP